MIARAAVEEGFRPVVAGRNVQRIKALAEELDVPHRVFAIDAPDLLGITLILNCAGPFSLTAAPVIAAALASSVYYRDITGEIDVFEHARSPDVKKRGRRASSSVLALAST